MSPITRKFYTDEHSACIERARQYRTRGYTDAKRGLSWSRDLITQALRSAARARKALAAAGERA